MRTSKLILVSIILISGLITCRKKCENKCDAFVQSNAKFKMFQVLSFGGDRFAEDTFAAGIIIFEVEDKSVEKVFWKIGMDTNTYNGKILSLDFSGVTKTLQVKCITYKKAPAECNGRKKEWDTVIRQLPFREVKSFAIYGTYKGAYTDGTGGERIVTLRYFDTTHWDHWDCNALKNPGIAPNTILGLHNDGTCNDNTPFCKRPEFKASYSHCIITSAGGNVGNYEDKYCYSTSGIGYLDPNNRNKIIIDFSWTKISKTNEAIKTTKTFVGYRLK